ncbi:MAG: uracil-DNA glycosylase [Candidatus Dormibacteria bacterium]
MTAPAVEALSSVHEQIRACVSCPLHRSRTQAVPGTGPATARIMAVGEAPGQTEDRTGEPFVGAAGQVLTRLLGSIGLRREDIYITNVIKCRPPLNRDPEPDEVHACSRFLDAQVELIRPDVILILGRHALGRLLPDSPGIGRVHGQRVGRGDRIYVPLYHPAAALHRGDLMRTLEDDMERVRGYLADAEQQRIRAAAEADEQRARAATGAEALPPQTAAGSSGGMAAGAGAAPREQLSLF